MKLFGVRLEHKAERSTEAEPAYLIVGLGNPEKQHAGNRHNVGFQAVDLLAAKYGIRCTKKRFRALLGEGKIGAHRVVLVKPQTYMNDSGVAVGPMSGSLRVRPDHILVIHDDLDLPLGKVRLRPGGSSGGHRGIISLIEQLGTPEFGRLRIGIGRPEQGDPVDYVLDDFTREQAPVIAQTLATLPEIVEMVLDEGIRQAMNRYNGG
jgi:peptidyl-tRNA hydrolase, PTH1 family